MSILSQNWGKVTDFVTTFQTAISQAPSGVSLKFQHPWATVCNCLTDKKGSRSLAPPGAELWPFKEDNVRGILAKLTDIAHPWSNACFSGLEGFFWETQKPRRSLKVPEGSRRSLKVPDRCLEVPERSLNVPEKSLKCAWRSLKDAWRSLEVPERCLEVPERSLKVPKDPWRSMKSLKGR